MRNTSSSTRSGLAALTLGAVGVVYGDIGTSPLYALKEVFAHGHVPLTAQNIYGVLSLVFWTLTVVVSIKYVVLILRADNNGEGGLIAMLALASQAVKDRPALRRRLLMLGIFGTAIFFGDGVITPAITVLGAIEGLKVAAPGMHAYVVPVSLAVLTALFMVQRHGTASIGKFFGPVMVLWFAVQAEHGQHDEPDHHHRPEQAAHTCRAAALNHEQAGQHDQRHRHDVAPQRRSCDLQAFHRREHRDRRRDDAVAEEDRGAEDAQHQQPAAQRRAAAHGLRGQRQHGDQPAFAVVVGAQDQQHILDRHHHRQGPEHQRQHAVDVLGREPHVAVGEDLFQRIERAGADVAIDDADRCERDPGQAGTGV